MDCSSGRNVLNTVGCFMSSMSSMEVRVTPSSTYTSRLLDADNWNCTCMYINSTTTNMITTCIDVIDVIEVIEYIESL